MRRKNRNIFYDELLYRGLVEVKCYNIFHCCELFGLRLEHHRVSIRTLKPDENIYDFKRTISIYRECCDAVVLQSDMKMYSF